jgi:hypothetical protein
MLEGDARIVQKSVICNDPCRSAGPQIDPLSRLKVEKPTDNVAHNGFGEADNVTGRNPTRRGSRWFAAKHRVHSSQGRAVRFAPHFLLLRHVLSMSSSSAVLDGTKGNGVEQDGATSSGNSKRYE